MVGKPESFSFNNAPENNNDLSDLEKELSAKISALIFKHGRSSFNDDAFMIAKGINPETYKPFPEVDGKIGKYYDAHGIAKLDQLNSLLKILKFGIKKDKTFYTAPFKVENKNKAAMGAAIGTSGGEAYKEGIATITSGFKKTLLDDGIEHVFINDAYKDIKESLEKHFPQYKFHLLTEQKKVLEELGE